MEMCQIVKSTFALLAPSTELRLSLHSESHEVTTGNQKYTI